MGTDNSNDPEHDTGTSTGTDMENDDGEWDEVVDWDQDEDEDPHDEIVRAKWTMDGAATLSEAAERLRAFAQYLLDREAEGAQLTGPIEDDYGFVHPARPDEG